MLFVLEPLQRLWEKARQEGCSDDLSTPEVLIRLAANEPVRKVFLHGPGGSGKTYCMTEVVLKVVRRFLGSDGVVAIASSNSTARLLRGKTMHSAGKMVREQVLKAKNLKVSSRQRKALEYIHEPGCLG